MVEHSKSKSTGGFYHPDVSPCYLSTVEMFHNFIHQAEVRKEMGHQNDDGESLQANPDLDRVELDVVGLVVVDDRMVGRVILPEVSWIVPTPLVPQVLSGVAGYETRRADKPVTKSVTNMVYC